jgi:hypothetical protein
VVGVVGFGQVALDFAVQEYDPSVQVGSFESSTFNFEPQKRH